VPKAMTGSTGRDWQLLSRSLGGRLLRPACVYTVTKSEAEGRFKADDRVCVPATRTPRPS
jgi:hypothetical protein